MKDDDGKQVTYPMSGVFKFKNPFNFVLILFVCALACCGCCCCCFFCSSSSCSCCWLSSNCWNFKLALLVSWSSHGSTNSNCERLWRHQKYAPVSKIRISTIMPSVERTPINMMWPISGEKNEKERYMLKLCCVRVKYAVLLLIVITGS